MCSGLLNENVFLADVAFGTSTVFSETETCVISRGQGGEEIYGVLRLTHVANAYVGLEIKNNHKHL